MGLLLAEALPCAHIRQVSRVQMRTPLYLRPDRRVARAVASAHACGGDGVWWRSQALGALLCSSLRSKRAELLSLLPSLCAGRHVRVAHGAPATTLAADARYTRSRCATPAADARHPQPTSRHATRRLCKGRAVARSPVARTPRRSDSPSLGPPSHGPPSLGPMDPDTSPPRIHQIS